MSTPALSPATPDMSVFCAYHAEGRADALRFKTSYARVMDDIRAALTQLGVDVLSMEKAVADLEAQNPHERRYVLEEPGLRIAVFAYVFQVKVEQYIAQTCSELKNAEEVLIQKEAWQGTCA